MLMMFARQCERTQPHWTGRLRWRRRFILYEYFTTKNKRRKKKKTATTAKGRKNPSSWEARPHPRYTYIIKNGYGFVESAYKTQYQWLHLVGLFRCSFQMGDYKFVYFWGALHLTVSFFFSPLPVEWADLGKECPTSTRKHKAGESPLTAFGIKPTSPPFSVLKDSSLFHFRIASSR